MLKSGVDKSLRSGIRLAFAVLAGAVCVAILLTTVSDAWARERQRTLKILFTHTGEKGEFTFKRNGRYDRAELDRLNNVLRDWRRNEPTRMDPKLFDLLWEVYQKTGSREYIHVVSGYRSLATNNMLRRRSRGVAKRSRHTYGQAVDFFIPGVPVSKVRAIALKMQEGGVGYYPASRSPFVHIDTGSIRHWPRMTRRQLAAVFPNGETVHVPSDGKPLPGYERALVRLQKNQANTTVAYLDAGTRSIRAKGDDEDKVTVGQWLKKVFAGGADEEEDNALTGNPPAPSAEPAETEIAVAEAAPDATDEPPSAPMPRAVPTKTRMILLAAAERSQIAAADELAMVALVSQPQTPSAPAAAPAPALRDSAGRSETAGLAAEGNAISAADRNALAALYLAAARRVATITLQKSKPDEPVAVAALPQPHAEPPAVEPEPSQIPALAAQAHAEPSYTLASVVRRPVAAPDRPAENSAVSLPASVMPRPAPPELAAAEAPGSAIEAANALGLIGTKEPSADEKAGRPEKRIEMAYASAGATARLDTLTTRPRARANRGAADAAKPVAVERPAPAPAYPAVTLNAHLTTTIPSPGALHQLMSEITTRTRAFAAFVPPRPERVPGLYIAPRNSWEAMLPTSARPPKTDRFALQGNRPILRFRPPRFASLY